MCGTLQCQDFNRTLYYYVDDYFSPGFYFLNDKNETIATCHSAIFDFGLDTQDPGQVPSGAECGPGKASFLLIV